MANAVVFLRIATGPNAGQVIPAYSEADVLNGIHAGDDVVIDNTTATVGNRDGQWYLNGMPVCAYFGTCPQAQSTSSTTSSTSSTSTSSTSTSSSGSGGTPGASGGMALPEGAVLVGIGLLLLLVVD